MTQANTAPSGTTAQSLRDSRWHKAEADTYFALSERLRVLAKEAEGEGCVDETHALNFLADLCGMGLDHDSGKGPFRPLLVMSGRRSLLPEDLSSEEVDGVAALAEDSRAASLLRARLADVAWLRVIPRNPKFARMAIDAYCAIEATPENWSQGRREEFARAIRLCLELGKDCAERMRGIEALLVDVVLREPPASAGFLKSAAGLLAEHRLGWARRPEIAVRLEAVAGDREQRSDWLTAVEMYMASAAWFERAGDEAAAARATSKAADMRVHEAKFFQNSPASGYLMAGASYETAVQLLRRIPRKHRGPLDVEARLADLRGRLRECNDRSLDAMVPYSGEPVDIREMVETARKDVARKDPWEALVALVRITSPPPPNHWRDQAKESIREYPLQALFSTSRLSADGRLIARSPGLDLNQPESPGWEEAIHERAVQNLMLYQSVVVQGGILPALDAIALEHRLSEAQFVALAARSPVVPPGRERMVGRGLAAGFQRDFAVAVHLLAPQVEHIVRVHVVALGGETRKLDASGIESEVGLSALMDLPEVERVFGESLAFELRAIFCDAAGSNLRNNIAHGLLNDAELHSAETVYAWWFCLRLVMLPLLQKRTAAKPPEGGVARPESVGGEHDPPVEAGTEPGGGG